MNRKWVYGTVVLLILLFLYRVRVILPPFLFGSIIAYIAYPLVNIFERRQVPRPMAIILVYLVFGVVVGVLVSYLVPQLIGELEDLLRVLPRQTERLEGIGQGALRGLQQIQLPVTLQDALGLLLDRIQLLIEGLATRLAELLLGLVSQVLSLLVSPILAFYLLRDMSALKRRFYMHIPRTFRRDIYHLLTESNKVLNGFIRGQLLVSALVGLMIAAGLSLVGIRYALFIGFLAGLFDVVPYFGPVIGMVPALALALAKSPTLALWVVVVFVIANQIEASVIAPKVVGERVGLHPLAVIFALLAGGELMGITGMLIAVPTAAIIRVFILFLVAKTDQQAV